MALETRLDDLETSPQAQRVRYGSRLRRAREESGLTQRELADALQVSHTAIGRAERGEESSEHLLASLELRLGIPDGSPRAPKDPIRRQAWVDARSAAIRGAKPPPSNVFGKGRPPEAA